MTVPFATSARSSVGLEWELMLADRETGDLVGRAPDFLPELEERTEHERFTVTGELLTKTIEVTSGIGDTVAAAVDDIGDAIDQVRALTSPRDIELMPASARRVGPRRRAGSTGTAPAMRSAPTSRSTSRRRGCSGGCAASRWRGRWR